MAGSIRSLIVKIGGDTTSLEQAIGKAITKSTNLQTEIAKIGDKPIAKQAEQDLVRLGNTLAKITADQARVADTGVLAARGIQALGGTTRLTTDQLGVMNRTLQQSIDAYRALGQTAPAELQKVATAVSKQQQALKDAQRPSGLQGLLGTATSSIGIGTLTGAGVAASLVAGASAALNYADSLTKLSDRTSISVEGLQQLDAVAQASGNNVEQIANAVNAMQKRIADGAPGTVSALGAIGLSIDEIRAMSPQDQFFAIAKGIQAIHDPAKQTQVAMELFGKSGAELLPTLKSDVDALKDSTFQMSENAARALDETGDAFGRLKTSAVNAVGEVIGQLVQLSGEIVELSKSSSMLRGLSNQIVPGFALMAFAPQAALPLPTLPSNPLAGSVATDVGLPDGAARALLEITRQQAEAANKAAAAARAQASALAAWRDTAKDVIAEGNGLAGVVDTIDGRVLEGIRYYTAQGVALSKLAAFYGLTAAQASALERQFKVEGDASRKAQDEAKQLTEAHQKWADSTARVLEISRGTQAVLDEVNGSVLEGVRYYVDLGASLKDVAEMYGLTTDQAAAFTAALKEQEAIAKSAPDLLKNGIGKLTLQAGPNPLLASLSTGSKIGNYLQNANLAGVALQSIVSGGGAKGAATSVASQVGGDLTKALAKSLAKEGASSGAKMAAGLIGPLGVFAGPAIEGVIRLIKGAPEWKRLQKDIGRDFGVNISDALAQALEADSKKFGRQAAGLLHLDQVISEAGGVQAFGTDAAISKTRDLFSMLETGKLTATQVGGEFTKLFGQILPEVTTKSTGLISKQFKDMIALADQFGIKSQALTDFKVQQAGSSAAGLGKFLGTSAGAGDQVATLTAQLGTATDPAEQARLRQQIQQQRGLQQATQIQGSSQAQAFASATAATFAELVKQGTPVGDAVKQIQPAVQALDGQLRALGIGGGEAFDRLLGMVNLATDAIGGPAIDAVGGIGAALTGLANTGNLDQQAFEGLARQVADTRAQLVSQGKDGDQALRLMQPTLQTIYELQQRFGYTVDDATQQLLDQAQAAGVVGEAMKGPQQQQIDALNKTNDILSAIAEAMGVKLPAAADTAAKQINDRLSKIKDPQVQIDITAGKVDLPPWAQDWVINGGGPIDLAAIAGGQNPLDQQMQTFATGGRVLPFGPRVGRERLAGVTPGEVVLTAAQQGNLAAALAGGAGSSQGPVDVHAHLYLDGRQITDTVITNVLRNKESAGRNFRKAARA